MRASPLEGLRQSRWQPGRGGIRAKLAIGFAVVLAAVSCLGGISLYSMSRASALMNRMAHEDLPEIQLASEFERNILLARIHFIYHVTIQKPGELEKGWDNFSKLQTVLPRLEAQAALPGMAAVRNQTVQLKQNLADYDVSLRRILQVVAARENHGASFSQLVAEWARIGNALVKSSADLNGRYLASAQASSIEYAGQLQRSMRLVVVAGFLTLLLGLGTAVIVIRHVTAVVFLSVERLQAAANKMDGVAREVTESSHSIAGMAAEQAASLRETTACAAEVQVKAQRFAGQRNPRTTP